MAKPSLVGKPLSEREVTPHDLAGRTISLNLKSCKWFMPPTQDPRLRMTADSPTVTIPETAASEDLECIFLKMKANHIIFGSTPKPEFVKQEDVLEKHLNMIKQQFPENVVIDHVTSVVQGVNLDGGYNKLEILEAMLEAEEINPVTRKGGRNRPKVIKHIREAIQYVEEVYGGVSRVKREEFTPSSDGASLREYTPAKVSGPKARDFLGLK